MTKNCENFWDPKQEHKAVHRASHVVFVFVTENKVRQLLPVSPESHKIHIFCAFLSLLSADSNCRMEYFSSRSFHSAQQNAVGRIFVSRPSL